VIIVKGKLKKDQLFIGAGNSRPIVVPNGEAVTIVDMEDHPLWGRRYKVLGFDFWFEANCFDYVDLEDEDGHHV
jgi:hypothetical protein